LISSIENLKDKFHKDIYILGKGPSLNQKSYSNIPKNSIKISINQVLKSFDVDFAFFIDIEPLYDVIDELIKKKINVIIPYHPNIRVNEKISKPSKKNIYQLAKSSKKLKILLNNDIYCFDTGLRRENISDFIFKPNFVSLTSLLQIIFTFTRNEVYGIGFDGGIEISNSIENKFNYTQVHSYDNQFRLIKEIEFNFNKTFNNMAKQTINVYVGAAREQYVPTKVLEYSIKDKSSINVNVIPLYQALEDKGIILKGRTPFSLQRLYIPFLNNYNGIAVYLDSDMLVFDDILKLVQHHDSKFNLCSAPAPPNSRRRDQYSVFTVDCSKAEWKADELVKMAENNYEKVLFQFEFESSKSKCIPWQWNSLEFYDSHTKLIHFTDMDKQPWISTENKYKDLWVKYLIQAIENNFLNMEDLYNSVNRDECRPGLYKQVINKNFEYRNIDLISRIKDFLYTPIHTVMRFSNYNNFIIRSSISILKKIKQISRPGVYDK